MKGAVGYMLKAWNKPERPSDEEIDTRLKIARENLTRNQIKVKEGKIPVFVIFEGWGAADLAGTLHNALFAGGRNATV